MCKMDTIWLEFVCDALFLSVCAKYFEFLLVISNLSIFPVVFPLAFFKCWFLFHMLPFFSIVDRIFVY